MQLDFNFLERYHPSSELFVPEQYRKNYLAKLQSKFDVMTEEEVIELETMDLFG